MSKKELGSWREFKTLGKYFNFFKDIPEEKWTVGDFINENGQMCALGLLGDRNYTRDCHPFRRFLSIDGHDASCINNGARLGSFLDLGDTPKERVLNAIVLKESGILEET